MKRYIAVFLALIMIVMTFTACGDTVIVDKDGNEHTPLMKKGEFVQDKLGNLLEEVENEEGKKVTQPFSFPEIYVRDKNTIENAYFVVNVPSGWTYDENLNVFRIQHKKNSEDDVFCEISFEKSSTGDVTVVYDNAYAREIVLQNRAPDLVGKVEKYETTLFGKEVSAYKCHYSTGSTVYFYAFAHASAAIGLKFIITDDCAEKISPEEFITENFTLKSFE